MPAFIVTLLLNTLGPKWLFKLGAIAAALVGLTITGGIIYHNIWMRGWNAHQAAIVRQDAKAINAALALRRVYTDCDARGLQWDQSTGQCAGR
jgi:hypothetical protein